MEKVPGYRVPNIPSHDEHQGRPLVENLQVGKWLTCMRKGPPLKNVMSVCLFLDEGSPMINLPFGDSL